MGTYVTMVVAVFLIVFTMINVESKERLTPVSSPSPLVAASTTPANAPSGLCRAPTAGEVLTFQAPEDNATKCPDGPNGRYQSSGPNLPRHILGSTTTYKLVRKNVPLNSAFFTKADGQDHSDKASDLNIQIGLDPTQYEVYFPQISSEVRVNGDSPYSRTRDCAERSYQYESKVYFMDYGMVFAVHLQNGQPVLAGGYYLTDVFQDTARMSENPIPQIAWDACSPTGSGNPSAAPTAIPTPPKLQVMIPPQQESTNSDQMQLSYFLFSQGLPASGSSTPQEAVNGWIDTCKPAIYLYPPSNQLVNVKVFPQGFLKYTDPPYDAKTGWMVEAHPDGILTTAYSSQPTNYPYLYYESKIRDEVIQKPTKGWVVKSESRVMSHESSEWFNPLEEKFHDLLPKLGLNAQQTKDFIIYWKKALKPAPYYFIGVVDQNNVDQIEKLEITPKPDVVNRVRIYFERLDSPKMVEAPQLPSSPFTLNASRFNVVEWGGMVKNDPNHPFTCSQ